MPHENGASKRGLTDILARTQQNRILIQDYRPLAESLEWRLGQHYYQQMGNQGFVAGNKPVPYRINNDGGLSHKAADLAFTALEASERAGALEDRIFVLEMGIGVGLFAKFFLDIFRDRCDREGRDYYERLCYIATDRSERMLIDAGRHGIFADHPGRYLLRVLDADGPPSHLLRDMVFPDGATAPIRAVFLNYVLDCMPAAHLQIDDDGIRQLYIRTYLARGVELQAHTHLGIEEIARLADADDPQSLDALAPLYGFFASEYDYRPVDAASLPFGEAAVELARGKVRYTLHNYGALRCLSRLMDLLRDDGFILVNDYGLAIMEDTEEPYRPQRFSDSSAVWLNFALISECLKQGGMPEWIAPDQDGDSMLLSRILVKGEAPDLVVRFRELFGKSRSDKASERVGKARGYIESGRFELATGAYEKALREQPWNWDLMGEVATFLVMTLRDPNAGLMLNRAALRLNPCCSSDLWNNLGDCLQLLERRTEAQQAFRRALRVNPTDPRAYHNLAISYFFERDFPATLRMIAESLAVDRNRSFVKGLLQLQNDVLDRLDRVRQFEAHLEVDRISRVQDHGAHKP
jgi:tetratricopeptide (TPR) repeat protein